MLNIDYLAPLGNTDHSVVIIHVDVCSRITNAIPKLNFNKGIIMNSGSTGYLDIDWDSLLQQYIGDIEMMWNIIKDKLLEGINTYRALFHLHLGRKINGKSHLM